MDPNKCLIDMDCDSYYNDNNNNNSEDEVLATQEALYTYHTATYSKPYPTSYAEVARLRTEARYGVRAQTKHLEPLGPRAAAPSAAWRSESTSGAGAKAVAGAGDANDHKTESKAPKSK